MWPAYCQWSSCARSSSSCPSSMSSCVYRYLGRRRCKYVCKSIGPNTVGKQWPQHWLLAFEMSLWRFRVCRWQSVRIVTCWHLTSFKNLILNGPGRIRSPNTTWPKFSTGEFSSCMGQKSKWWYSYGITDSSVFRRFTKIEMSACSQQTFNANTHKRTNKKTD